MMLHAQIEKLRALPEEKKKTIAYGILGTVAVILGIFWITSVKNSIPQIIESLGQSIKNVPDLTGDQPTDPEMETMTWGTYPETDTWKTYTNKEYGFSMRYPNDWFIQEGPDAVFFNAVVAFSPVDFKQIRQYAKLTENKGLESKEFADFLNAVTGSVSIEIHQGFPIQLDALEPDQLKRVTVGSAQGYRAEVQVNTWTGISVMLPMPDKTTVLSIDTIGSEDATPDKLISTFTFTQ